MRLIILYFIFFVFVIFVINWFAKREYLNKQFARKLTHVFTGIIVCTFPIFIAVWQIMVLSGVFVVMMGISKLNKILILNNVDRVTWGEVYFPASIGICAVISLPQNMNAYFVGILSLTFADTVANIVGGILSLKIINIRNQTKSVGGFLSCLIVVFVIFSIFFPLTCYSWILILSISIIISIIEVISIYGIDNITVPVAATILGLILKG